MQHLLAPPASPVAHGQLGPPHTLRLKCARPLADFVRNKDRVHAAGGYQCMPASTQEAGLVGLNYVRPR